VSALKKGNFIAYSNLNMKRAPTWSEMAPFADTLRELLDKSNGKQVLQTSMVAGVVSLNEVDGLGLLPEKMEKGSYALRCMISQMANHKQKGRGVPRPARQAFETIFEKLAMNDDGDESEVDDEKPHEPKLQQLEDEESEVHCESMASSDQDLVSVASSQEMDAHMDNLFNSDDPELNMLLNPEPQTSGAKPLVPRCRFWTKTKCPEAATTTKCPEAVTKTKCPEAEPKQFGTFSAAELAALVGDEPPLDPRAFAKLNQNMKAERALAKSKARKPRQPNTAKKGEGENEPSGEKKSSKLKLEHSRSYHKEFKYCTKTLGLTPEAAKLRAQSAAKARTAELRAAGEV
jgi:hypothetical protein